MPNSAISSLTAGDDAVGAELPADRSGQTVKLTPEQLVTSRLASTTPAAVGAAAVGVGTTAARADHVHAHGDQDGGTLHADATTSVAGFMSASDKTKLDGVATGATATPLTAATPQAVGTAAVGVSTDAARADHVHVHGDQAGGTLHSTAVASGAAGFMSGSDKAKLDGIATGATATPLSSTTPAAVGTAAVGVGTTAARADHVHAHGNQSGGSLHSAATTSVAGFMSSADKTKLDGVGRSPRPLCSSTTERRHARVYSSRAQTSRYSPQRQRVTLPFRPRTHGFLTKPSSTALPRLIASTQARRPRATRVRRH